MSFSKESVTVEIIIILKLSRQPANMEEVLEVSVDQINGNGKVTKSS